MTFTFIWATKSSEIRGKDDVDYKLITSSCPPNTIPYKVIIFFTYGVYFFLDNEF